MTRTLFLGATLAISVATMAATGATAAPIDLASSGFSLGTPSYTATNGVAFYDTLGGESFSTDFLFLPGITGFANSEVSFFWPAVGSSNFSISYTGLDNDFYSISQAGFTDNTLQFLIERPAANPTVGNAGDAAFVEITSGDFDFAGAADPFSVFAASAVIDYDIDLTIQGLTANPISAIPLPAGFLLLGSALLFLRRRG